MSDERTYKVKALTRVEGEGGLHLRIKGDRVDEIRLEIYEPPRLFESLLRGRELEEVPDITARICGICPVAYQMSSVHALEQALDVEITPEIRSLRRLLYCGEWIESHALHIYLLNAPDFYGVDSGLALAEQFPDEVNRGLRLKKHGNQLLEILGGRAIHPINVGVGGFYRAPDREALHGLLSDLEWCLDASIETARWVAGFEFPNFEQSYQFVAVHHDDEYAMNEGSIAIRMDGEPERQIPVANFEDEFEERQVPHSTALHSFRKPTDQCYFVGPLARMAINYDQLCPAARQVADELSITWPTSNPFHSIVARAVELVHAFAEAIEIIRNYREPKPARIDYRYRSASGCAATEAPRGVLYHHYSIDAAGKVLSARIIPPTSQNQAQIESDLRAWAPSVISDHEQATARQLENLVRSYDPCISCSTHFLQVEIERA